jgi:TRAP-type C4-dicarboxylate transport system permease large subunit
VAPELTVFHVWRYLGALTLALILIAAVPWFSTVLVK